MSEVEKSSTLICLKCNVPLKMQTNKFSYLGFNFNTEIPTCPRCGLMFLSEELVKGKVTEVEKGLEDK
ncbi:DVU_1557 family redox protein [Acetobacterium woodii]|uniref:DVU_1557 family redox protein n=1 Tax=Acetobacterium woodii TaxID=33952 RepID=UPI0002E7C926|nr:CLJU_RS11820 family redox protein [Acetobacterium woodii]